MNLSMFVQDFSRLLKKKAKASKDKRFQKYDTNPRISLMMFGLEKP